MKNGSSGVLEVVRSRRRKAEGAVSGSIQYPLFRDDEFFHLLAENARDLIFHASMKPSYHFDYVSPSSTTITGYTPEEFYADPFLAKKCIHPDDFKMIQDPALYENTGKPVDLRWTRKDGMVIWTEHMITLIRDKQGQPDAFLIIARDITERKMAEAALHEAQQFNESLLNNAPHATVVIAPDTSVKYVSPSWEKLNGWSYQEAVGAKIPYPWWPADFVDAFAEGFKEAMKMPAGKGEVIAQKKNGELYWIEMNWTSVSYHGEPGYMVINSVDITDRKKMEEALKESEEKFSKSFASNPNPCCIIMAGESKFIDVNESFLGFSGYSREEIIGHTPEELSLWVSQEEYQKTSEKIIKDGHFTNEQVRSRSKNGEIRTGLFSAETVDIGGKKAMILVITDITDEVKTKEALRESEEKFSKAFYSSPDMLAIINLKTGKFTEVNTSYARMLGYNRDELLDHNVSEFDMWVDPKEGARMNHLMTERGKMRHEEFHFRTKTGKTRTWLCSADTMKIGGELSMLCVATDITERKEAQKALRESEEKFSAAFHSSPDMIIITDTTEGKYVDVNESFCQHTGYTREELVGHSITEFDMWVDPAEADTFTQILQKEGRVKNMEYRFRRKDREIRTWLCSADVVTIGGEVRMLAVAADITEMKQAEKALKETEERFAKAFNASPISISISRLGDGKFIEVNDSFLRDKGYTRDEIIGHSSRQLKIWANEVEENKIMRALREKGGIHNELVQFRTKSGHMRTGLMSAEVISIGNEACMLILNNDITQQKQAEEQIRLLSSVTQQVSDSTIIADPNFKITYMNKAAQDLFGYTMEEARGKSLGITNAEPISDTSRREIMKKLNAGKVWKGVAVKKHKSGRTFICDCHMSPLYDEKGQICSYIDVQRDITQQKEVEARLQEHKKLIDSILATMPEGVLVMDAKENILLANKAFHSIFHVHRASLDNRSLDDILPVEKFHDLRKAIKNSTKEDNTLEFRYQVQGQEKIIDSVIEKMDADRTLVTFSDVSREREEEEKLYLTDRLASIGEMAAGIAHELNNPLTGILALSQMLVGSDVPDEHKEDLECIHTEARRAASIVKNILLFARNKTDVSGRSSVNEVIRDVLKLRDYEERTSNIKVVTNLEDELPEIIIDKGQLQQVLLNMISNAEAAIKDVNRPGVITVTTQRVNNHVNILFSDNGCGIKKQIMPRIFDPFFTTKEIGKGTGLGLSICYSIIVKNGGKISVKSQVNEGTTFTIRLPVALSEK